MLFNEAYKDILKDFYFLYLKNLMVEHPNGDANNIEIWLKHENRCTVAFESTLRTKKTAYILNLVITSKYTNGTCVKKLVHFRSVIKLQYRMHFVIQNKMAVSFCWLPPVPTHYMVEVLRRRSMNVKG